VAGLRRKLGLVSSRERTPLTRQRILETALALVDRDGLGALSMRRLGAALGVEAMSLYHHVPDKDAILDGLVELASGEVPSAVTGADPAERLKAGLRSYRRSAIAHPEVFRLRVQRLGAPAATEVARSALRELGLDDAGAQVGWRALVAYTIGFTLTDGGRSGSPELERAGSDAGFEPGLDVIVAGIRAFAK
jgi:TetR/AcrR family transcriptional regulator, tetracycline repressor protein